MKWCAVLPSYNVALGLIDREDLQDRWSHQYEG
jgi:hypothetical protein